MQPRTGFPGGISDALHKLELNTKSPKIGKPKPIHPAVSNLMSLAQSNRRDRFSLYLCIAGVELPKKQIDRDQIEPIYQSVLKFISFDPENPIRLTTNDAEVVRLNEISNALGLLHANNILTETIFDAVIKHPQHMVLARALNDLNQANLYDLSDSNSESLKKSPMIDNTYIFESVLTHPHPDEFVNAMKTLNHQKIDINKVVTDAFVHRLEPLDVVRVLGVLSKLKLLTKEYIDLVINHPKPLDAANLLIVCNRYNLLDESTMRKMLKSPDPKAVSDALKFMSDNDLLNRYPKQIIDCILMHDSPIELASALKILRQGESSFEKDPTTRSDSTLRKAFDLLVAHNTQPIAFANILLFLHSKRLDTPVNIEFIDKLLNLCNGSGSILSLPKHEKMLLDMLAHPERDNLLKVLIVLGKSNLVNADNVNVLMDAKHPQLLDSRAVIRIWLPAAGKMSQEKFTETVDAFVRDPELASVKPKRHSSGLFDHPYQPEEAKDHKKSGPSSNMKK